MTAPDNAINLLQFYLCQKNVEALNVRQLASDDKYQIEN